MRKRSKQIALLVTLLLVLSVVPGAASSPPLAVSFEVPSTIPPEGPPSYGPFTATGPAVEAGLVCASGDTVDLYFRTTPFQSPVGRSFQVVKLFTCSDGSGEFQVKLQVRIDQRGDNFQWMILGGTGAYEHLRGTGKGIGVYDDPEVTVTDLYWGIVHMD